MKKVKFSVAMDIRAYGVVKIHAESVDQALEQLKHPDFNIGTNFEPYGNGSDDLDYGNYNDVSITAVEEGDEDEYSIDCTIPCENDSAMPLRLFAERIARYTTPEDETDGTEKACEEFVSDFSGDRAIEEYTCFMSLVREARKLLGQPERQPVEV